MPETYISLFSDPNPEFVRAAWIMLVVWVLRAIVFPSMVSAMFVRMTISLSHQYDVLARPSDRGSHTIPTPRLGGVGSAAAFYVTLFLMTHWGVQAPLEPWRLVLLVGGAWALIGGALDDFQELPPRWKLLLQLAACGSVIAFRFQPNTLDLPFAGTVELAPVAGLIIATVITLFMMNIFNFMDGMDGQASVFGIVTGLGLATYLGNHGFNNRFGITWTTMYMAGVAAVAAATLMGVLIYNYPGRTARSKTFLGDCGSQFYGFILAVIALQAAEGQEPASRFPWIASLILFSPFIYDVVYTLIRRMRRGENLTQAHRTHLYQRLMVAGWSHGQTLGFNFGLYLTTMALSWLYAASYGRGFTQLTILILTGIVLAGYSYAVIVIERQAQAEARRQA